MANRELYCIRCNGKEEDPKMIWEDYAYNLLDMLGDSVNPTYRRPYLLEIYNLTDKSKLEGHIILQPVVGGSKEIYVSSFPEILRTKSQHLINLLFSSQKSINIFPLESLLIASFTNLKDLPKTAYPSIKFSPKEFNKALMALFGEYNESSNDNSQGEVIAA